MTKCCEKRWRKVTNQGEKATNSVKLVKKSDKSVETYTNLKKISHKKCEKVTHLQKKLQTSERNTKMSKKSHKVVKKKLPCKKM